MGSHGGSGQPPGTAVPSPIPFKRFATERVPSAAADQLAGAPLVS